MVAIFPFGMIIGLIRECFLIYWEKSDIIDMGIRKEATMEEAVLSIRKRRKHRTEVLNDIEAELVTVKGKMRNNVEDANKWKRNSGFKPTFSTHETWMLLRETYAQCSWARGI